MYKKYFHYIGNFKFLTSMYFMAILIISMLVATFSGVSEFSLILLWQLFGLSVLLAGLHYIYFSRFHPALKVVVHSVMTYLAIVLFSYFGRWGFIDSAGRFLVSTGIFIFVYIAILLAFLSYYKIEEDYLNKKLNDYKEEKK